MPIEDETGATGTSEIKSLDDAISASFSSVEGAPASGEPPAPAAPLDPAAPVDGKPAPGQPRDEAGRFAQKVADDAAKAAAAAAPVDPALDPAKPAVVAAAPPPGWPVAAKAAFGTLPPVVQEAIAKRETEVSDGFKQYEGLKPYLEEATRNGTTLPEALRAYGQAEQALMKDFRGGILHLCQTFGVNPQALAQSLSGGQSQARPPAQSGAPAGQSAADIEARREIQALKHQLQQFAAERDTGIQSSIEQEISAFASRPENVYFQNVQEEMAALLNGGQAKDLKEAYDMAVWARPDTRAELLKQQAQREAAAANQKAAAARNASGSLATGLPVPGASSGRRPMATLDDAISNAFESIGG